VTNRAWLLTREGAWFLACSTLAVLWWTWRVQRHEQWTEAAREYWRGVLTSPLPPPPSVLALLGYAVGLYAMVTAVRLTGRYLRLSKG
jgi:hypothetical protein